MEKKSLVSTAYDVLTKRYDELGNQPMKFEELLLKVGEELSITKEEELIDIASRFYTDLTLDGRFVIKENNTWVLKEHELYDDIHIDMNEVYSLENYEEDEETKEKKSEDGDEDGEISDNEDEENNTSSEDDEKESELGEEDDEYKNTDEEYEENN